MQHTGSLQRQPHWNMDAGRGQYSTMSFRNQNSGNGVGNSKKRTGEYQLSSEAKHPNSTIDPRNGMWRRPKHQSHNAYSTLPRKIHSIQSNHPAVGERTTDNASGRRPISSGIHTLQNPRDGLHLPITSIRSQCPPLPPMRGDSSGRRNSERRLSDITYAQLGLNQQMPDNAQNLNNSIIERNQSPNIQASIAPLSDGVPAELRVTSPTTVYATIGINLGI